MGQSAGDRIQSLDAKEIVSIVLKKMPAFTELDETAMTVSFILILRADFLGELSLVRFRRRKLRFLILVRFSLEKTDFLF